MGYENMKINGEVMKYLLGSSDLPFSKEWGSRIKSWMLELLNHFYIKLGTIELSGFTTMDFLTYEEALNRHFSPMPQGSKWGAKWEYGWFKGSVKLPDEALGRRIVIMMDTGAEGIVFVNGKNAGSIDRFHDEITISMSGVPGEIYDIIVESYAGHGPRIENIGPTPPGRTAVPEPGRTQATVGESSFGIWDEDAFQLFMDVSTLYKVLISIDKKSLRAQEIYKALCEFTLIVDFEQPYEKRVQGFKLCRKKLKPLLQCVNGSTMPLMYIFGQSHLDLAWLWTLNETKRKAGRTLSTQLALMDEYPDYKFFITQPPLFIMLKEHYPELYKRVLEKVHNGQIMPEGGMWVEPDTNMPSGESLVRQFIYGKRFFMEEFGIDSKLLWLPDTFGFSAALPQIAKGCGIKYFSTQKIVRNYYEGDPFPYNIFMWEGIDGTQILTHIHKKNNSHIDPEMIINRWENDRNQQQDISTFIFPFGFGDGGGGPTRYHIEYARRMKDLEGVPRTKMSHPNEFFEELENRKPPENRYVGELYFQAHRGTYTTQAKTKKGNRKSEIALRECEFWQAASSKIKGTCYPYEELESLWKTVLFNQFHDILAGTSIKRVHEEAEADYETVLKKAGELSRKALSEISGQCGKITVFNSLSWDREELIALPEGVKSVKSLEGYILPAQNINGTCHALVKVPACGWTTVEPVNEPVENGINVRAGKYFLENEFLRVTFNEKGQICSIIDRQTGFETVKGLCNDFRMYRDITSNYDAWDIDSMYEKAPVPLDNNAEIEVLYQGRLQAAIRVRRKLNNSEMTQEITLRSNSRRVDFKTTIDWREDHKLLKVNFPTNIHTNEALHEIQFGYVKRPNHRSRQYDADRFEVCNHKWTAVAEARRGFAILNDCKYGVNVSGGSINLTLLKSPLVPDMTADRGIHEFTYSFYLWNGSFEDSDVIREAYNLNTPVSSADGDAGEMRLFSVDRKDVIIETVKLAEDRSGDVILRLYQSTGATTACSLHTALPVEKAWEANMLEETEKEIEVDNRFIRLVFRPFEVKTLRLVTK